MHQWTLLCKRGSICMYACMYLWILLTLLSPLKCVLDNSQLARMPWSRSGSVGKLRDLLDILTSHMAPRTYNLAFYLLATSHITHGHCTVYWHQTSTINIYLKEKIQQYKAILGLLEDAIFTSSVKMGTVQQTENNVWFTPYDRSPVSFSSK